MTTLTATTDPAASIARIVEDSGVVAVLRARTARHFPGIVEALLDEGVRAIEITLTAEGALEALAALTETYRTDATVAVGAGTILNAQQADDCIAAGAAFLVSPVAAGDVLAAARRAGIPGYSGALTPTEVLAGHLAGATAVKLFPASAVGHRYLADLRGPLPQVKIMPTGGIGIDDIESWLRAGAYAVGLGGPLLGAAGSQGPDRELTSRARAAARAVVRARDK